MTLLDKLESNLTAIEGKIGYTFKNRKLLLLAFIHRSFVNEYREEALSHNERLEFLGDSVLGLCLASYLYEKLPDVPEGHLSELRSRLVDANSCAECLQKLHLGEYILLGRGEAISSNKSKTSILADVFEALLGAIYLDGGLNEAKSFLLFHFDAYYNEAILSPKQNAKAELQDIAQKRYHTTPQYKIIEESGPDHAKTFRVAVFINNEELGTGSGPSRKLAEQSAAAAALAKGFN